jgi:hypothetical protein
VELEKNAVGLVSARLYVSALFDWYQKRLYGKNLPLFLFTNGTAFISDKDLKCVVVVVAIVAAAYQWSSHMRFLSSILSREVDQVTYQHPTT